MFVYTFKCKLDKKVAYNSTVGSHYINFSTIVHFVANSDLHFDLKFDRFCFKSKKLHPVLVAEFFISSIIIVLFKTLITLKSLYNFQDTRNIMKR